MSGGKKQQKNGRDSIKDWRFHVLPPERLPAAVYHVNQPGLALAAVSGGLRANRKLTVETRPLRSNFDLFRFHSHQSVRQMSSIKRDVKKKVLPRPEGEKILSRDPAHFTVRVPLDLRERFRSEEHTSELQSLRHLVCRLLL